ncbi:MAG: hypothetical protein FWF05_05895 [Oscillospiraceae bacterium]|nr:hypothetical protein [Oscillospiraceae bacterium]
MKLQTETHTYKDHIEKLEDDAHLISMSSADDVIRLGYSAGLNEKSRVLDLCCGFGTMLKI